MTTQKNQSEPTPSIRWPILIGLLIFGGALAFIPAPEGLSPQAWRLFAIFATTIAALILEPMPMGSIALLSLTVAAATQTLSIKTVFNGFAQKEIWLIVFACFIARAFIKTGLAGRIAYGILAALGKTPIGLSYGFLFSGLLIAPAMPSSTARAGGIMMPIMRALATAMGSHPDQGTEKKIGTFLALTVFHGTVLSSAMFLTAMAPNPIIADGAQNIGIELTWGLWAKAAIVPGLISALCLPWILYLLAPPEMKRAPHAVLHAKEKLQEMGSFKLGEWKMMTCFIGLLLMWIFGSAIGLNATTSAMIGVSFLILTQVLNWNDLINERTAWETLFWFAALLVMANNLNTLGFISWVTDNISALLYGISWPVTFTVLILFYYYSHYLFASVFAHVSSMYVPFLVLSLGSGTPPLLAALGFAFASGLFGGLTHYSSGQAPVVFSARYVNLNLWWKTGFIMSLFYFLVWGGVGMLWWKWLEIW